MRQVQAMFTCTTVPSLVALSPKEALEWDACAPADNPFVRHAFLAQLERCGCVGTLCGWLPCHQMLRYQGAIVACVPLYLKSDSFGEFIFDWGWAAAAQQHGIAYYPKLTSAVPYTPATGPRILCARGSCLQDVLPPLLTAIEALRQRTKASGIHFLFAQEKEVEALAAHGFVPRQSSQYHFKKASQWQNFDDFTAALRAPSRKQVRLERARAQSHGLTFSFRDIGAVNAADLQAMYQFYRQTVWEKGAHAYLTASFFAQLNLLPAATCYVAMAHREQQAVAGALFFRGEKRLFGRYWGAREQLDALHFELCYYLPIEWGLVHGIEHFEAGAQGDHKLKRGLMPAACFSAHRLIEPRLANGVRDFCAQEAQLVQQSMAQAAVHGPFPRAG